MFPEWTELESKDIDAIQHLRLNELRDSINEMLFPYITLITPYLRVTSWLVWALTQVDKERKASKNTLTPRQYEEKTELYYQIFATADAVHAKASKIQHHGPVGIERINTALDQLEDKNVDFTSFLSGARICPIDAYSSAIGKMELLESMLDISRRNQYFLISTNKGQTLSDAFERNWCNVIKPNKLQEKTTWRLNDLESLGEAVCLHGLTKDNEESILLLNAAKSSLANPQVFNGIVEITLRTAKISELHFSSFKPQDVGRASLYHAFKEGESFLKNPMPKNQATAMMAYHELHTHTSYGADAILAGVSLAAKNHEGGIMLNQVIEEATEILSKDPVWAPEKKVRTVEQKFNEQLLDNRDIFQPKIPLADGPYGLETIQNKIGQAGTNAYKLTCWGAIALLQAAYCEECFNPKWLSETFTAYGSVFSSHTFLQELQSLDPTATIKNWLEVATKRTIEQHEAVANSKGPYARKIEQNNGYIICTEEPTDYSKNRGRLDIAIAWISDAGFLIRQDNEYNIRPVN